MHAPRSFRRPILIASFGMLALLMGGCTGGTPWGAMPERIEIPVPDLRKAPEVFDGVSGSTQGSLRVAQRVRSALTAQPSLASLSLQVEGLEGGLIVLSVTGLLLWSRLHTIRLSAVCVSLAALLAGIWFMWTAI